MEAGEVHEMVPDAEFDIVWEARYKQCQRRVNTIKERIQEYQKLQIMSSFRNQSSTSMISEMRPKMVDGYADELAKQILLEVTGASVEVIDLAQMIDEKLNLSIRDSNKIESLLLSHRQSGNAVPLTEREELDGLSSDYLKKKNDEISLSKTLKELVIEFKTTRRRYSKSTKVNPRTLFRPAPSSSSRRLSVVSSNPRIEESSSMRGEVVEQERPVNEEFTEKIENQHELNPDMSSSGADLIIAVKDVSKSWKNTKKATAGISRIEWIAPMGIVASVGILMVILYFIDSRQ